MVMYTFSVFPYHLIPFVNSYNVLAMNCQNIFVFFNTFSFFKCMWRMHNDGQQKMSKNTRKLDVNPALEFSAKRVGLKNFFIQISYLYLPHRTNVVGSNGRN